MHFTLTLFTNDPDLAAAADRAGVDRIGLDLDHIGKHERQLQLTGNRINRHRPEQLEAVRDRLTSAAAFCRTNPIHPGSADEIEQVLRLGAQVLMLPMFRATDEVQTFVDLVAGRARVVLLLEHMDAVRVLGEILAIPGIDEIHVGLNDLALSLGEAVAGRWDVLNGELLARISRQVRSTGVPFHLGGLGRSRQNDIPLPSDLVYAQWPRLGASGAILAQVFFRPDWREIDLSAEVEASRRRLSEFSAMSSEDLEQARIALQWWIRHVANP
ncbi:MAG: hypothetical protein N838_19140 [Thiohalocapsa sp. PB-PSB1]|jgi:2-keto-3-deoxy-L-rhamnonate aldolase RhmA|nr:MAG: hypothetical protein N838_19140 [Thiohalocapsa sp. PB-PSB1]